MKRQFLAQRLVPLPDGAAPFPDSAPPTGDYPCGDHDLNPGTYPRTALIGAAVLVTLIERQPSDWTVLLTQRTDHLAHHPGQISFPGGQIEESDASAVAAALRETEEEVGLAPTQVEVLGQLETYVTRTGFRITPVVGVVQPPLHLEPDPHEVAEVFEVPLAHFLDRANHQRHRTVYQGKPREFYAMPYGRYYIWGATAGMLKNLCDLLLGPVAAPEQGGKSV